MRKPLPSFLAMVFKDEHRRRWATNLAGETNLRLGCPSCAQTSQWQTLRLESWLRWAG